jgi:hypothetical protein
MENGKESVYPSEKWIDGGHPMLDGIKVKTKGLTKREHFAGLAMQSYINHYFGNKKETTENVAQWSINMADALIEALSKP